MWTCPKCGRTFQRQEQSITAGKRRKRWMNRHNIIQFAGFKNHVGLYPGPEAVREFSERLKDYRTSKGTIRRMGTYLREAENGSGCVIFF
ncbi:MAG: hypothetical protein HFI41_10010 [Lachnospiraceae bacterium]|nr:hypothetical protein [Lachnospiraceae bacterium]